MGIPQLAEAIKQNRETINQIVESQPEKQTAEENPLAGILDHPLAKDLVGALKTYFTGDQAQDNVDTKVMGEAVKIYKTLMEKRAQALDLMTQNFMGGGQILRDEKGNIVITGGKSEK